MGDTLQTLVDLFTNNWVNGNTDSITPTISKVFDKKRVGGLGGIVTWVAVYSPTASEEEPIDLGYNTVNRVEHVTVDIRTQKTYSHSLNCKDEAKRILRANRKSVTGFDVVIVKSIDDKSNALRNLWRWILELDMHVYGESVS